MRPATRRGLPGERSAPRVIPPAPQLRYPARMIRPLLLTALFLLAACEGIRPDPRVAERRDDNVTEARCREASDRMLTREDRGQLLREDERNARLGSETGGMGIRSQIDSMGRQARLEQMVRDCVRQNRSGAVQTAR
jgi:hypothetical protein